MNVFMPYKNSEASVKALDNKRLCKQVLECMQLINIVTCYRNGYSNHPVTQHYSKYYGDLVIYARDCVLEYNRRFNREHAYFNCILDAYNTLQDVFKRYSVTYKPFKVIFYHEGSDIRIYDPDKSTEAFQNKLCEKWIADIKNNRPPKWPKIPKFFLAYLKKTKQTNLKEFLK